MRSVKTNGYTSGKSIRKCPFDIYEKVDWYGIPHQLKTGAVVRHYNQVNFYPYELND